MPLKTLLAAAGAAAMTFTLAFDAPARDDDHHHDHPDNVLTLEVITDPTPEQEAAAAENDGLAPLDHGEKGHTYPPDHDGVVPTFYGGDCHDGVLAYATWWSEGDWYIVYDKCEMDRLGAGPQDWDNVGRHEKAHTDGWGHYEEPRDRNAAFEPGIVLCGC